MQYRVREAIIPKEYLGEQSTKVRAFIAERRARVLGMFPVWCAIGDWTERERHAAMDIVRHMEIHQPVSPPRIVDDAYLAAFRDAPPRKPDPKE